MPNRGCKWDNGILWSTVTNAAVNRIIRAKCWFGTHFTTGFQLWSPMFINSDEQCKKTHWRFNWKWKLRVRVSVEEDRVGGNRKFIVSSFFFLMLLLLSPSASALSTRSPWFLQLAASLASVSDSAWPFHPLCGCARSELAIKFGHVLGPIAWSSLAEGDATAH